MSATLAILTVGVVSLREIWPFITEHIPEERITYINLMGNMTPEEVKIEYAAQQDEERMAVLLNDNQAVDVSRVNVERNIQTAIDILDRQGIEVILVMSPTPLKGLSARGASILQPQRVIPPLISSIVEGHRMGVIVPVPELLKAQRSNWVALQNPPQYALANPQHDSDDDLISAGRKLMEGGADVLMLDSLGFHPRHRELLQKTLGVPVLLSNALLARLIVELLS